MSPYQYVFVVLSITLSTIFNSNMYLTKALNDGFSVELIGRDSPKSPFYNSSETQFERMTNAIHRSFERIKHFYPEDNADRVLQSPISNINGEFLMKFSIGTPKVDVMAIVSTGSDLVWVQCQPCTKCFKQTDPIFDPSKSKTYKVASCSSRVCGLIKKNGCKRSAMSLKCKYEVSYGEGSASSGDIAEETLTFDTNVRNSPTRVDKIIIGCGRKNEGHFSPQSTGVVGLGNSDISLASQLGGSTHHKFSYCLSLKTNIPSLLSFGEKATVSGPGTVSTPLISGRSPIHYYINLKGMTVAGKRINFVTPDSNAGNIAIDSGSTLTLVPADFYAKLESIIVEHLRLPRVTDKNELPALVKLCYKNPPPALFKLPPITVHFDGADIQLDLHHIFIKFANNLFCFAFNVAKNDFLYGIAIQYNFHVGIDRQKKVVSFRPTECNKL
ncbi:unnamed protein product [Lupinus luteus]|uniref:Peptidase A1 domain-containing protein n=1 Tax=Lupinus luteus TaxID=3873 RepID=A0AAV1VZ31_LUPLU